MKNKAGGGMGKDTHYYIQILTTNQNIIKLVHFVINVCCVDKVDHNRVFDA